MAEERVTIIVRERGTRVVKRRLAEVGGVATKSAAGVNLLRTALIGLGGALVLTQTVRTIANFEQAMSTVRAVSAATDAEWRSLTATARELGATTRFTATQAAEGMVALSRAGFQVSETMESVDDTLFLAQAGALSLERAAQITAGTIRGFRLEVDQASRVTDVLAFAANDAQTDVNELGDAMKFVAPAAAGMGVSLEEAVAAVQALSDASLKGTLGGTGLRRTLSELESPSGKTRKILKSLGLTVDDVRVSTNGLTPVLIKLRKAGVSTGLAYEIFGDRAGGAAEVLMNSIPLIQENRKELENAGGTAKRIAEIMDDNLNGALLKVKSAWEAVQLSFGATGGSVILRDILEKVAGTLRFLAENIEIVDGAIIALTLVAIPKLIAAMALLAPALGLLLTGAAVGALVAFRHEIELSEDRVATLGDVAAATWERITEGAGTMLAAIKEVAPSLGDTFGSAFEGLDVSLEGVLRGVGRFLDLFVGSFRAAINAIKIIFQQLAPILLDLTIQAVNGMIEAMEAGINRITGAVGQLGAKLPGAVGDAFEGIGIINLPKLENSAEGAASSLGSKIALGVAEGFEQIDVFEKSFESIFDRADEIAEERLANQALIAANASAAGPVAPSGAGGAPPLEQGQSPAFAQSLVELNRQMDLLRMSNAEREVQNDLLKIENSLREQAVELNADQREQLQTELQRLQLLTQISQAVDQVRRAEIDLAAAQAELNAQVAAGTITLAEAKEAYSLLQDAVNETSTTTQAGFERGLNSINRTIHDFAGQTETTLVNAFNNAEDALVNFVKTGKVDFKSLVDSILGDLTRLVARQALVGAISAFGGGAGGGGGILGSLFGGGKANGGDVSPGQFFEVGEKGPELFTPSVPGQIVSNEKIKDAVGEKEKEPEGGGVTVIVVQSMEEALAAMESAEGKRIIVNANREGQRELA